MTDDGFRLQMEAYSRGIEIRRMIFSDIREVFTLYPDASAVFNCTGLGSLTLGGVEDNMLYPARVCYSPAGFCYVCMRGLTASFLGSNNAR